MKEKENPYDLDFTKECTTYREQKTRLLPFCKSEFIFSCKIGTDVTLPNKNNRQMLLTMELVQRPATINYKGFGDPNSKFNRSTVEEKINLAADSETEGHLDSEGNLANHGEDEEEDGDENAYKGNMFKKDGVIQGSLKKCGIEGGIFDPTSGTYD
jgi:hypothetical protein